MFLSRSYMKRVASNYQSSLPDGGQIHINHEDCPAGVDNKSRLYIKRDGNRWLFYCHHCGNRGAHLREGYVYRAHEINVDAEALPSSRSTATDLLRVLESSAHGLHDIDSWSSDAIKWWTKYGFTLTDSLTFRAQYNTSDGRLWLKAGYNLWQGRGFNTKGMKYYTVGDITADTRQSGRTSTDTLVLVEDILSAYKIRLAGGNALALLGTHLKPHHHSLIAPYNKIVIMMDGDSAGRKAAVDIYKTLSITNKDVITVFEKEQPKEMSMEQLQHFSK